MADNQPALGSLPQSSNRLIKYTVGHYRNKDVSHEDFVKWFTHEHLPAALPLFKKHGISKYTLVSSLMSPERLRKYLNLKWIEM